MIYFIVLIIVLIFILSFIYSVYRDKKRLLDCFKSGNCLVYGRKGKGKDLLFQYVINKRKKYHYANMIYNKKTRVIEPKKVQAGNNDFGMLIENTLRKFDLPFEAKRDIYFSDGGIIFPSQYNHLLNKVYKGMPISFALSRQLGEFNIHTNSQAINRVWKSLREQTDNYIWVRGNAKGLFFIKVNFVIYQREDDALAERLPLDIRRGFFKRKNEHLEIYNHQVGNPIEGRIYLRKRSITFDTHYFGKKLLNKHFTDKENKRKKG